MSPKKATKSNDVDTKMPQHGDFCVPGREKIARAGGDFVGAGLMRRVMKKSLRIRDVMMEFVGAGFIPAREMTLPYPVIQSINSIGNLRQV